MGRLFGTDGVRGVAGEDLTGELAYRLGRAAALVLREDGARRPEIAVGRDTRASGEFLEAALAAGICSAGGDAVLLGVVPTPAVAFLTADLGVTAGAVISASHNPASDNGIKFFASNGFKFPDGMEERVEALVGSPGRGEASGRDIGRVRRVEDAGARHVGHIARIVGGRDALQGMRVVVDCANGAASDLAPELLRTLGAQVTPIHDHPDGWNINDGCGATHPEVVARAVPEAEADAGICHDGDADRALFADHLGKVVDGDHVLAACALDLHGKGQLAGDRVVTTVMANLGFKLAMQRAGIEVSETRVGDRYVLEEMERWGAVLGGEQSGHVIFREHATTGDGLLTAAVFLGLAREREVRVADVAACMEAFPQVLLNVAVADRAALDGADDVWRAVRESEAALGERGRVLVRPSGTEPLVRVMVEAATDEEANTHARSIAAVVRSALGPG
jgi:phosphoglucosamine mutase